MTYLARSILAVVVIMTTAAGGTFGQESPYNRDIRDLKATILDLKGLPSNLNSAYRICRREPMGSPLNTAVFPCDKTTRPSGCP
jgi:hypothetical protein